MDVEKLPEEVQQYIKDIERKWETKYQALEERWYSLGTSFTKLYGHRLHF